MLCGISVQSMNEDTFNKIQINLKTKHISERKQLMESLQMCQDSLKKAEAEQDELLLKYLPNSIQIQQCDITINKLGQQLRALRKTLDQHCDRYICVERQVWQSSQRVGCIQCISCALCGWIIESEGHTASPSYVRSYPIICTKITETDPLLLQQQLTAVVPTNAKNRKDFLPIRQPLNNTSIDLQDVKK